MPSWRTHCLMASPPAAAGGGAIVKGPPTLSPASSSSRIARQTAGRCSSSRGTAGLVASSAAGSRALADNRARIARTYRRSGIQRLVIEDPDASLEDAIRDLEATGLYEFVEPDYRIQAALLPSDTALNDGRLWGLLNTGQDDGVAGMDINVVDGWDITTGSPDVVIAIVDSGIRETHRDLRDNLWQNPGEIPDNGIDDDLNGFVDDIHGINAIAESVNLYDNYGHGTHIAGTIAATAFDDGPHVGVAFNSRLMILKVLGSDGSGLVSDAVQGIEYAIDNGAEIINASWGGYSNSAALRTAIEQADAAGVLVVAAAGNSSRNTDTVPNFPSSYSNPNIVSVGAINRRGQLASFSNFGNTSVDIAAPGEDIWSTVPGSDTAYGYKFGTSMATPHVTGVLALLASQFPDDDHLTLKSRLMLGVQPLFGLQNRVVSEGIPDAYASLSADADGELEVTVSVDGELVADRPQTVVVEVRDLFPVVDAEVTAQFDDQPEVTLVHTGGGIYSGAPRTPPAGSEVTVYVTASAPGKTTFNTSETFPLLSPPSNDNYADRILLTGPAGSTIGNNRLSSEEPNEPIRGVGGSGRTVWWEWNAPDDTQVTFTTAGSDFDTKLSVYSGDDNIRSLLYTAFEGDADGLTTHTFTPVAGGSYKIRVDGYYGDTGNIVLNYPAAGEPGPPVVYRFYEFPVGASIREQDSYNATFFASGAGTLTYQWYFNGEPIPGQTDRTLRSINYATVADQGNYHVVITNEFGSIATDPIFLAVEEYGGPPVNDRFENAIELEGVSGTVNGSNIWAERESYESGNTPNVAPIESVWWTWTPPGSGLLEIDTVGSDFDTTLGAYKGSSMRYIRTVMTNDDAIGLQSKVAINVAGTQPYHFSVDGYRGEAGSIQLNYRFTEGASADRPFNDDFANALDMTDLGSFSGSNHAATAEPGEEPGSFHTTTVETVWFSWLAKRCGEVTFDTRGSSFQIVLSVRQGDAVDNLEVIDYDLDSDATVTISPVVGRRYFIAVDGRSGDDGDYNLNVNQAVDNAGCGSIYPTDVAAAGHSGATARIASYTRPVDGQPRVNLAHADDREPHAQIPFFNSNWDGIAIDSLADANGDDVSGGAVIAMLASNRNTGQIKVQFRDPDSGDIVRDNMAFFNSGWRPIDIAALADADGDGSSSDPAIAVLAENKTSGRTEVEVVSLAGDPAPVFKGRFFSREWRPVALDSYVLDGDTVIAVLAALPEALKSKVQQKRLTDGASLRSVFAFGSATAARDFVTLDDGNGDGDPGDSALAILGTKSVGGATTISIRDAASGTKIAAQKPLGRGFMAEKLSLIEDLDGNGQPEFVVAADSNADGLVLLKLRDTATEQSNGEIWLGDRPPRPKD